MMTDRMTEWPRELVEDLARFAEELTGTPARDIWACGSRVFGGFRPDSDLDLAVRSKDRRPRVSGQWRGILVRAHFVEDPTRPFLRKWLLTKVNLGTGEVVEGDPAHEAARNENRRQARERFERRRDGRANTAGQD